MNIKERITFLLEKYNEPKWKSATPATYLNYRQMFLDDYPAFTFKPSFENTTSLGP